MCRKNKTNDKETKKSDKKKIGTTNKVCIAIIVEDFIVTLLVLLLCYIAVLKNFSGSLPFLVSLIGLQQVKTSIVVTAVVNKSKKENSKDGIVYESAMAQINANINTQQDCD